MKSYFWSLIPLSVFALLALVMWRGLSLDPKHLPSVREGKRLPEMHLPTLTPSGGSRSMPNHWYLLNVWASWCDACKIEHPFLLKLCRDGVMVYGLNYKDKKSDALEWLRVSGNPYKQIWRDSLGKMAIELGVYGAPETFLIDQRGIIIYRHVGVLDKQQWETFFIPRINQL